MKTRLKTSMIGGAVLCIASGIAAAETVTIGHFGNPTPMQVARAEGAFEEATGWDIEWREFSTGTDVIAAVASGDVQLSELGSSPLAIATSQGVDLQLFMIAQVIGEAESLIARDGAGIETLADLEGKRVAVPVGSTAHFSLMGALAHADIDESDLTIINMPPDQIAAAWEQDAIDAAFVWQPVQSQIRQRGELIVGADQTAEWGNPTFDGWVVNTEFAETHAESVAAFAATMNEANAAYLEDPSAWTADSEAVQTIATQTGADPEQIPGILEGFAFLPLEEQASDVWLGSAPGTLQSTAEFLANAGRIDGAQDDYSPYVNLTIIETATD